VTLIKRAREEPALPQPATNSMRPVHMLCVAGVDWFQHVSQCRLIPGNGHKMDMIGHQAVGEYLQSVFLGILPQQVKIPLTVSISKEHIFSSVPTLSYMMCDTSHNSSCQS
jgi:hypothetical protein